MFRFHTESGSQYELDITNSRVRRITGNHPPTERQGPDGEWRKYRFIDIKLDRGCLILWDDTGRGTYTSKVTQFGPSDAVFTG